MSSERAARTGAGLRPVPRPIGVFADKGTAWLVMSEGDLACLADHRGFDILRGRKSLGLALPGETQPLFVVDLEAELDLRLSAEIDVLVVDPGVLRKAGMRIHLTWR